MLMPFTHESAVARRWPVLTTLLIALNVFAFVATVHASMDHRREVQASQQRLIAFWGEHKELATPPALEELGVTLGRRDGAFVTLARRDGASVKADAADQAQLDELAKVYAATLRDSPARTWGYVPKENNVLGLLTSQFVHGGLLHLVSNLWFLWLCACNIEDRWGRWVFLPMYLSAGVVATLAHRFANPMSDVPIVGASGAIAGAMGAFLVLFARTRIRFVYLIGFRPGTFLAPAWVMLPLWLANEVLWGLVFRDGGDGTARILEAGRLLDAGQAREALGILDGYLVTAPTSIDGHLELLRAAHALHDTARMSRAYARLVDLYLRADALSAAESLYFEADAAGLASAVGLAPSLRLAQRLAESGEQNKALRIYDKVILTGVVDATTAPIALAYADLLFAAGRADDLLRVIDLVEQSGAPGTALRVRDLRARIRPRAVEL